jgi:hypothetical protein
MSWKYRVPDLTEEMKQEGREWRIEKCSSPRHEDLRREFYLFCCAKYGVDPKIIDKPIKLKEVKTKV